MRHSALRSAIIGVSALAVVALLVGAVGYAIYQGESRQVRATRFAELRVVGDLKTDQILEWRNERLGDVAVGAAVAFRGVDLAAYVEDPGDAAVRAELASRLEALRGGHDYADAIIAAPDGRLLMSLDPDLAALGTEARALIAQVVASGGPAMGDLVRVESSGNVSIDVAAPILDASGRPTTVLLLRADPSQRLYPLIHSWPTPSESAETLLVRRDGEDVLFLNVLRHRDDPALTLREPLSRTEIPAVAAALGRTGEFEGTDYRGVAVVADIRPIPDSSWFLVAKVDAAELLAEVDDRGRTILLLGLLVVLLSGGAIGLGLSLRQTSLQRRLLDSERERASAEGIRVTAAIRDISERKEAQEHLAQSEARYRGLLEAAPDAMVVVDQRGEIVLLNVQAEKQFGYSRDELVGQPVTNIIPEGFAERIIADDLRSAADALAQVMGTGIELVALRRDGTEFPIEIMLSPLESAEGILVTAAIRNISVRRAAEARYRGLLEAAPDAMVVVDQRGEIVLLNVQAEKQFGYSRDELVGQPVTNIIPVGFAERIIADDLRSTADALAQVIGTGLELVALRRDGTEFPIEIMLSPLESAEGILVTAAIRDISVRKAAEEHLRRTTQLLETTQTVARVGGWELDLVHDTLFWNDETYRIHETSPAEFSPTLATAIQFYAPESIPLVTAAVEDAIERGTPFDLELELITATGRRISVRAMGTVTVVQGRTTKISGAFQDISVRKAAEVRYRGLLEAAPDAMVVVDQAGGIVVLNVQAEKQFGYQRDELLGQPVTNIIPEGFAERIIADDLRSAADALAQVIGTGIELVARRKDGTEFPIEIMLSPLESAEGTLVTAAIRDISVRKAAVAELRHLYEEVEQRVVERTAKLGAANQELESFSYSISHDLRAPLRAINGFASSLARRHRDSLDEQGRHYVDTIVAASESMGVLIDELLDYSRLGRRSVRAEAVPLGPIATRLRMVFGDRMAELGATLEVIEPLATPKGDPTLLERVLVNLIDNALTYHRLDVAPHVTVSATRRGQRVAIAVADNGIGIPAEYRERIFDVFARLHADDEYPGTGIGLAIVRKAARVMGSDITVESTEGQGSTFSLELPVAKKGTSQP